MNKTTKIKDFCRFRNPKGISKKSQITVFIIAGIIILLVAAVFFNTRKIATEGELSVDIEKTLEELPTEFMPVRTFIDGCILEIGEQGLRVMGEKGGFVDPLRYGITTKENPTESDAVKMSPGADYSVPYWYYMKSSNDCVIDCDFVKVPDNKLFLKKREGSPSIEHQLEEYINDNLNNCLNNFQKLKDQGFGVEIIGNITTTVDIKDQEILVLVDYPLEFSKEAKKSISRFFIRLPINLKNIYELAKEIVELQEQYHYLEKDVLNLIVIFSSVDGNKLPPMHQTKLGFEKITWPVINVKKDITNMLTSYIQLLQVNSTLNHQYRNRPNALSDSLYNSGMLLPVDNKYPNLEASFRYNNWWPIFFDIDCGGGVCKPESISSNLISLIGFQRYNFVYDISFPTMIEIKDPYAFNNRGYTFYLFMEANIRDNEPMDTNYIAPPIIPSGISTYCNAEKRTSGDITIKATDTNGYDLDDITIVYTCAGQSCIIGKTEEGILKEKFPPCLGGIVSAVRPGYLGNSKALNTEEGKQESVEFTLDPILVKKLVVKKKLIEKKGKYWIPTLKLVDLKENERAVISLERMGAIEEEQFTSSSVYEGNQSDTPTIRIVPGTYRVNIFLLLDETIKIPAQEVGDQVIPEQELQEPYNSGGLIANYTISMYNLKNSDTIVFYALSPTLYEIPEGERTFEDLEYASNIEKYSKLYGYGSHPRFE